GQRGGVAAQAPQGSGAFVEVDRGRRGQPALLAPPQREPRQVGPTVEQGQRHITVLAPGRQRPFRRLNHRGGLPPRGPAVRPCASPGAPTPCPTRLPSPPPRLRLKTFPGGAGTGGFASAGFSALTGVAGPSAGRSSSGCGGLSGPALSGAGGVVRATTGGPA